MISSSIDEARLLNCSIFGLQKQKVTRHEMIQRVRHIAGDKLLMTIIKSYRSKVHMHWPLIEILF